MIDLAGYLWIVWLIFILVFVIIELLSLEFTFLMLAFGSVGGLGAHLLGWPWWLQIAVAAVLSVLLILTIRPLLLRTLRRGADPRPTNVAALMGLAGRTVGEVTELGGLVKLANGETWSARIADASPTRSFAPGSTVRVTAIEGSIAVIVPADAATGDHPIGSTLPPDDVT